jgi:nicotinate-nucleotide--dimethylbenzimidazole phosphoribosyltransferase
MDLAEDLAGMTWSLRPPVERKAVVVVGRRSRRRGRRREQISAGSDPADGIQLRQRRAGINALARVSGARVVVVDMG